jgi:hypothetical protein
VGEFVGDLWGVEFVDTEFAGGAVGRRRRLGFFLLFFPALALRLRSGQAGWANVCRAYGAHQQRERNQAQTPEDDLRLGSDYGLTGKNPIRVNGKLTNLPNGACKLF